MEVQKLYTDCPMKNTANFNVWWRVGSWISIKQDLMFQCIKWYYISFQHILSFHFIFPFSVFISMKSTLPIAASLRRWLKTVNQKMDLSSTFNCHFAPFQMWNLWHSYWWSVCVFFNCFSYHKHACKGLVIQSS